MANRHLLFRGAARDKMLHGATALADAVRVTLGPRSKCVLIEKKWGKPLVCNDGVTIAKEVELKDPEENLGARMIREAAEKTGDAVGDGTSTATTLAHAIFAEELGLKIENVTVGQLGTAKRVKIDKDTTTVIGGGGKKEAIAGRIKDIRKQIEKATSGYDKEKLEERLAKLAGGVAVIRVGAPTEAEMKSRKEAFEDAIIATKAAVAEGVVPRGGLPEE